MTRMASSRVVIVVGALAEDTPSRIAATDAEVHPAAGQLVQHGQGRGGDRRLAGGRVGHAGPEPQTSGRLAISVSSTYGSRHRTCESNSQP